MVNRPSVPEIITVNSETLQTQIRDLLPSQNGFGSELQASNVIQPIIDLTSAAEGSSLPSYLQTALAFSSQTTFDVTNTTSTIINLTGFFRVFGTAQLLGGSASARSGSFSLEDGSSAKKIFEIDQLSAGTNDNEQNIFDFVVFLAAGESLTCTTTLNCSFVGSFRQLATGDGTLVDPGGFPL